MLSDHISSYLNQSRGSRIGCTFQTNRVICFETLNSGHGRSISYVVSVIRIVLMYRWSTSDSMNRGHTSTSNSNFINLRKISYILLNALQVIKSFNFVILLFTAITLRTKIFCQQNNKIKVENQKQFNTLSPS